ncbi:MAG: Uma2 family endonuclease [Myxococcota bacterium]|nr:Uma2 family endonuclease [Myxococcota bacterium]
MGLAARVPPDPGLVDHVVVLHGVTWAEYEAVLAMRGERSVPRITYCEGRLELMTPSRWHELGKKALARLIEAWSEEAGIVLEGIGSWTLKQEEEERGAEPDECYFVASPGRDLSALERPDFAIEVVWTRGAIDKLEVYRRLGVREVWIWEKGALSFHVLRGEAWERSERSELLPSLDPALIADAMTAETQSDAVRKLRAAMRAR